MNNSNTMVNSPVRQNLWYCWTTDNVVVFSQLAISCFSSQDLFSIIFIKIIIKINDAHKSNSEHSQFFQWTGESSAFIFLNYSPRQKPISFSSFITQFCNKDYSKRKKRKKKEKTVMEYVCLLQCIMHKEISLLEYISNYIHIFNI